ncbi:MAG: class B sortase [Oscillospiraceae bacterium]|jgi:sortase B|nr:class B sortase [Oscillospiraceae bacterium]
MAAAYNTRPRTRGVYINGKKRNPFARFSMRFIPWKGDSIFEIMRKIIFLGALSALIYFGGREAFVFGNDLYQQYKIDQKMRDFWNVNIPDDIRDSVLREKPEILPEYIMHWDFNNDLVGHILIPDMNSSLPYSDRDRYIVNYLVYQTNDNKYYLDRAFDHTKSEGGTIFADFRNNFADGNLSGNTILYGHNIYTGNYFHQVASYFKGFEKRDLSFYQRHPIVHFNTLYERHDWKIFATVLFNTDEQHGEVFPYLSFREFRDKEHFHEFILGVMDRSVLFTDVDLMYGDHILTLSTCYWPYTRSVDTRAVVFARRVREGESSYVDVNKAQHNEAFLPFELQRRRLGSNWAGRVWDYETYLLCYNQD